MKTLIDFYDGTYWQHLKYGLKHWFGIPFNHKEEILEAFTVMGASIGWLIMLPLIPILIPFIPVSTKRYWRERIESQFSKEEIEASRAKKREENDKS